MEKAPGYEPAWGVDGVGQTGGESLDHLVSCEEAPAFAPGRNRIP